MIEPRRLREPEAGGDDPIAALLDSARHDGPSPDDRRAVAIALGLAAATATTLAAGSATAAGASAGGTATTAAAAKLGSLTLLKIGAGVVIAFSLGVVTGVKVQQARTVPPPAATSATTAPPSSAPIAPPVATADLPAPVPVPVPVPVPDPLSAPRPLASAAPSFPPAPLPIASTTAAPASSLLAQETELVSRARQAIARHDPAAAIAALDAYDVLAPRGVLSQEARALRVQALADQGKRLQALELGRAFLAAFPGSPYERRVRAIVDALDADGAR